jgi:hypothetical protein
MLRPTTYTANSPLGGVFDQRKSLGRRGAKQTSKKKRKNTVLPTVKVFFPSFARVITMEWILDCSGIWNNSQSGGPDRRLSHSCP